MDLPEFGGGYHGKCMSGRSYTPSPDEMQEVVSFIQKRNPKGIREIPTRKGKDKGTPEMILNSLKIRRKLNRVK